MADIFAGTTPPAWLVAETAQQPGQLGDVAGLAAGGLMNALQRDPNAPKDASWLDSRKGVGEGIAEARLNIADPLWKLKVAQTQATVLGRMAQAQNAYASAQQKIADTSAWMQDSQTLTPWLSARPEDRQDMPAPAVRSKAGATLIERTQSQDSRYFIGKEANRTRDEAARLRVENNATTLKHKQNWDDAYAELNSTEVLDIEALQGGGRDQQNNLTSEAKRRINDIRRAHGKPEVGTAPSVEAATVRGKTQEKIEGKKEVAAKEMQDTKAQAAKDLEAQKAQERATLEAQKAAEKQAFEETRQQNRLELTKEANKYKIDLEKFKADLKVGKDGKTIGRDEFVNRHYNTVFNAIVKDSGRPADASRQALNILERSYDNLKPTPKAAPATQGTNAPPATATAAPAASTNAPAADKDPLGIFK